MLRLSLLLRCCWVVARVLFFLVPGATPAEAAMFAGWGEPREVVNIRPVDGWAREGAQGVIPFTTFEAEKRAIVDGLGCTWQSEGGQDGATRYDFMCKGGTWASVSLIFDKAPGYSNGIGRVRMMWQEWPENLHPAVEERPVVEAFLHHVAVRFIPVDLVKEVEAAFLREASRQWWSGRVLRLTYTWQDYRTFGLHKLEIAGLARQMANRDSLLPESVGRQQPVGAVRQPVEPSVQVPVVTPVPVPEVASPSVSMERAQQESGLARPEVQVPVVVAPKPQEETWQLPLPRPVEGGDVVTGGSLTIPQGIGDTPEKGKALVPANRAELETQPEPETLKKPVAPQPVSATMVPGVGDVVGERPKAPSNFETYNKAEELTRKFEKKARIGPNDAPKVVPAAEVQRQSGLSVEKKAAEVVSSSPMGGAPVGQPVSPVLAVTPTELPEARALPQLKFVPRARPLEKPDEVIRFEDEKSRL